MKKLFFTVKTLSIVGIMLALYLLFEQITRSPFQPCNINSFVNCNAIISGAVSKTLGIPTPLYGLIGYIVIFFCAVLRKKKFLLGMATFGLLFCLWIAYRELFQLHVICPVCILCQIDMMTILVLAIVINKHLWKIILTGLILIIITVIISTVVFTQNKKVQNKQSLSLTQPYPTMISQNTNWKRFTDTVQKISFEYPGTLQTTYIRAQRWPPKITVSTKSFSCIKGGQQEGTLLVIRKTMNGREYCIENITEGAAGTFYSNYTYTFVKSNKLVMLQFTIAYPQCMNYIDPQKTGCKNERQIFDLDMLINKIAQSVTFYE